MSSKSNEDFKAIYDASNRLHCEDGPAVTWNNGTEEWFLDGLRHREDGPAVERRDGYKEWWIRGSRHRMGGHAIEYSNGIKEWWIEGKRISLHVFDILTDLDWSDDLDWSIIYVPIR